MILNIVLILGILFVALQLQKSRLKIASPLTIVLLTPLVKMIYPEFMEFLNREIFSEEMLVFIVLLVLADAYVMKFKEVKENWVSLVYLAGVGVVVSVFLGVYLTQELLKDINLSYGALIALFAMCMATDPVSVIAVFKKFKIPHKLKFLAEGESLFNDAAALIMFNSFGIAILLGTMITFDYTITVFSKVVIMAIIIGLVIGFIGTIIIKYMNDLKSELILILLIAYTTFEVAEFVHASGLLAEIIAIITLTTIIHKSFDYENRRITKNKDVLVETISVQKSRNRLRVNKYIEKFMTDITNIKRYKSIEDILEILALIINGVLFVSLANIINVDLLLKYKVEILSVFGITILVRFLVLGFYSLSSKFTKRIPTINVRWFIVLNLAGIKGGLSIVMLHILSLSIPHFEHLELFNAIISGVIILSILIYIPLLIIFITLNKNSFEKEYLNEKHI